MGTLRANNRELIEKVEELSRECQDVFARLESYEQCKEKELEEKNREKEALQEELVEREREV